MIFSESRVTAALFSCPEGGGHLYPVSNAFLTAVKPEARYRSGLRFFAVFHDKCPRRALFLVSGVPTVPVETSISPLELYS